MNMPSIDDDSSVRPTHAHVSAPWLTAPSVSRRNSVSHSEASSLGGHISMAFPTAPPRSIAPLSMPQPQLGPPWHYESSQPSPLFSEMPLSESPGGRSSHASASFPSHPEWHQDYAWSGTRPQAPMIVSSAPDAMHSIMLNPCMAPHCHYGQPCEQQDNHSRHYYGSVPAPAWCSLNPCQHQVCRDCGSAVITSNTKPLPVYPAYDLPYAGSPAPAAEPMPSPLLSAGTTSATQSPALSMRAGSSSVFTSPEMSTHGGFDQALIQSGGSDQNQQTWYSPQPCYPGQLGAHHCFCGSPVFSLEAVWQQPQYPPIQYQHETMPPPRMTPSAPLPMSPSPVGPSSQVLPLDRTPSVYYESTRSSLPSPVEMYTPGHFRARGNKNKHRPLPRPRLGLPRTSQQIQQEMQNGTHPSAEFLRESRVFGYRTARDLGTATWPVLKLEGIDKSVTLADIETWLPSAVLAPQNLLAHSIHFNIQYHTGITLPELYIEVASMQAVDEILAKCQGQMLKGKNISIDMTTAVELISKLFALSALHHTRPEPHNVLSELRKLQLLCADAVKPSKESTSPRERPFYHTASLICKYPWSVPAYATQKQQEAVFDTAIVALRLAQEHASVLRCTDGIISALLRSVSQSSGLTKVQKELFADAVRSPPIPKGSEPVGNPPGYRSQDARRGKSKRRGHARSHGSGQARGTSAQF